jgi:carbon monoxide dehydrogenase subunit G
VELGLTVAAIAGSFKGTVALEDKDPPHAYTLVVEGNGRQGSSRDGPRDARPRRRSHTRADRRARQKSAE